VSTEERGTEAPVDAEDVAPEPERLHGALVTYSRGQQVLHVSREDYLPLLRALADDGFHFCADVTAADYLQARHPDLPDSVTPERFEVVVNLLNMQERRRIRVRVQVPGDDPVLPSLFDLFPGTEAPEREVFDMFGIRFEGHPDLTRILMPEDWIGHPLRKDYEVGIIPVQFKGAPSSR